MHMKLLGVSFAVFLLLVGCGSDKGTSDKGVAILYTNDVPLKHEMEGVIVEMTYVVNDSITPTKNAGQTGTQEDVIVVQGTVNLLNETDGIIYFTPTFYAIDETGKRYEKVENSLELDEQIVLPLGEQTEFQIAFILSIDDYNSLSELEVTVPVPYLEPDSESSGDALGDTTTWVLKIKE